MHRKTYYEIFLSLFLLLASYAAFSQCSPHKIAKNFKPNLAPYKYDSYDYNEVTFADKPQTIEVVFTAFAGVKYKLVFGTSMFDENVSLNIYDKSMHTHKRKKLYDNSKGVDNLFWSVEITDPGIYYIDYDIPAKGTNSSEQGCMVLMIGCIEK
jgi:hypothetical protein